ncbi:Peptidyl-prolyl cis-trans isomerase FKBP17-2, chloroplastic, partial [Tetrabaena socialis]
VVETMRSGDVKLAVVPPSLGYGAQGVAFKSGRRVPPNARLYYEVNLLRCQSMTMGLACCSDADFPCIKKKGPDAEATSAQP